MPPPLLAVKLNRVQERAGGGSQTVKLALTSPYPKEYADHTGRPVIGQNECLNTSDKWPGLEQAASSTASDQFCMAGPTWQNSLGQVSRVVPYYRRGLGWGVEAKDLKELVDASEVGSLVGILLAIDVERDIRQEALPPHDEPVTRGGRHEGAFFQEPALDAIAVRSGRAGRANAGQMGGGRDY